MRQRKTFHSRSRAPHISFLDLAENISNHELFGRWISSDTNNQKLSEIKILLLESFRYLRKRWTFDDI